VSCEARTRTRRSGGGRSDGRRVGQMGAVLHRQTASRLLDCPFELYGTRRNGVWFLEVHNSEHNHEASEDMSGHPITYKGNPCNDLF